MTDTDQPAAPFQEIPLASRRCSFGWAGELDGKGAFTMNCTVLDEHTLHRGLLQMDRTDPLSDVDLVYWTVDAAGAPSALLNADRTPWTPAEGRP